MKRSFGTIGGSQIGPVKRRKVTKKSAFRKSSKVFPGKISPSDTTLARYPVPYPPRLFANIIYENGLTVYNPLTTFGQLSVISNSCYDFDQGTAFGNKQPLFWDNLTGGGGPYKKYKVISWKTTYTVINNVDAALTVYALPPTATASEIDIVSEAENFPGVKRLYLSQKTGTKNLGSITVTGHISDVFDSVKDDTYSAADYNASPTNSCFGGLCIASADTTLIGCWVSVKHEMYTELTGIDVAVS